tara:strand:- start:84494 stop:85138 length:645 start_codon:yes stop_codon:yes gene_type:complete
MNVAMKKMDVVDLHAEFFDTYGFVLNQSQLFFEREFLHGKQVIFVHYVELEGESYIEYHLGIRINAIEELIQKYLPAPDTYAKHSMTLVQSPSNLGSLSTDRVKVSGRNDLSEQIISVQDFFLTIGFNWLNQMIDPIILEQEFLNHKENPFEAYNLVESAFRSTALSKLYNPTDYPVLRQAFLEKINSEEMTPFSIASFLQFLNYLDNLKSVAA